MGYFDKIIDEIIEVKQLDWREPEIVPYKDGTVKLIVYKKKVYRSTGFQILEQGDNTFVIRETFFKRF